MDDALNYGYGSYDDDGDGLSNESYDDDGGGLSNDGDHFDGDFVPIPDREDFSSVISEESYARFNVVPSSGEPTADSFAVGSRVLYNGGHQGIVQGSKIGFELVRKIDDTGRPVRCLPANVDVDPIPDLEKWRSELGYYDDLDQDMQDPHNAAKVLQTFFRAAAAARSFSTTRQAAILVQALTRKVAAQRGLAVRKRAAASAQKLEVLEKAHAPGVKPCLHMFLHENALESLEEVLKDAHYSILDDLEDAEDVDLLALGFTKVSIKRMRRGLAARATSPKLPPSNGGDSKASSANSEFLSNAMPACLESPPPPVPRTPPPPASPQTVMSPRLKSPKLPPSNGGNSKASSANSEFLPKAMPACLEPPLPPVPGTAPPPASPQTLKSTKVKKKKRKKKTSDNTEAKYKTETMSSFPVCELSSAKETGIGQCLGGN